ncbi:hypothetical protein BH11GEM1_BH11GEM1_32250 [soil metagenome]
MACTLTTERRRLIVDLAARSRNWALTPEGAARLHRETPAGWEVVIINAATSSDGDGPAAASDEALNAITDA